MSSSCTPGLVGVAFLVSEIWLPFKIGQICHLDDYNIVHGSRKI